VRFWSSLFALMLCGVTCPQWSVAQESDLMGVIPPGHILVCANISNRPIRFSYQVEREGQLELSRALRIRRDLARPIPRTLNPKRFESNRIYRIQLLRGDIFGLDCGAVLRRPRAIRRLRSFFQQGREGDQFAALRSQLVYYNQLDRGGVEGVWLDDLTLPENTTKSVECHPADFNQDGRVDSADLELLLRSWGRTDSPFDLNRDGVVDREDLELLLISWGHFPCRGVPSVLVPDGLVGYWTFEGHTEDLSGFDNHAILSNASLVPAPVSLDSDDLGAIDFGVHPDAKARIPHSDQINFTGSFSIASAIYITGENEWMPIYSRESDRWNQMTSLFIKMDSAPHNLRFTINEQRVDTTGSPLKLNTLHYVVATFNASDNRVQIYVDGVAQLAPGGVAIPGGPESLINTPACIGDICGTKRDNGLFQMNELRLYNRALSSQEVKTLAGDLYNGDGGDGGDDGGDGGDDGDDGGDDGNEPNPEPNQAPVASSGSYQIAQGSVLNAHFSATDPDSGPAALSYQIVSQPGSGTVTQPNGQNSSAFRYTPPANYHGTTSFQFRAFDGAAYSNTATVSVTVLADDSESPPNGDIIPKLVPGAGFSGLPNVVPQIGSPGVPGYNSKAIARWDVVQWQDFTGIFEVGVVAFHSNGIDRVEFSVEGGPWVSVDKMVFNPRTGVNEYTVALDAADFADGQVEVQAVVYPKTAGKPRVLAGEFSYSTGEGTTQRSGEHSLVLFANAHGTLPDLVIELQPGNYTWGAGPLKPGSTISNNNGRWIIVRPAPGVSREQVVINSTVYSNPNFQFDKIALHNLTLEGRGLLRYFSASEQQIWMDRVVWTGSGQHVESGVQAEVKWATDSEFSEWQIGPATRFIRGCTYTKMGEDVVRLHAVVINTLIDGLDRGPTNWHAAVFANPYYHDNRIYYGVTVRNSKHPVWSFRNGTHNVWENKDVALVNCDSEAPDASQNWWMGGTSHNVYVKDSRFIGGFSWRLTGNIPDYWVFQPTEVVLEDVNWQDDPEWRPQEVEGVEVRFTND